MAKVLCEVLDLAPRRAGCSGPFNTRRAEGGRRATGGVLFRLPSQSIHAAVGWADRRRRDRMPHHGDAAE